MYKFSEKHNVIKDYSEFSGMGIPEISNLINTFHHFTKKEWEKIPSQNFREKARFFYQNSQFYIFDLLSSNYNHEVIINKLNSFSPLILTLIRNHPGERFLEFGGGLGVFCEIVLRLGKKVTYLDIPGQVSDFAVWRFKKYNLPIEIIISKDPDNPSLNESYDIIFSDAVLEHTSDPQGITNSLCQHVNKKGLLILLIDLSGPSEKYPMHRNIDITRIHHIIKQNSFSNIIGENTFCSIWEKL